MVVNKCFQYHYLSDHYLKLERVDRLIGKVLVELVFCKAEGIWAAVELDQVREVTAIVIEIGPQSNHGRWIARGNSVAV